jgi:hypothetical protein
MLYTESELMPSSITLFIQYEYTNETYKATLVTEAEVQTLLLPNSTTRHNSVKTHSN